MNQKKAVFIDLSNFYGQLINSKITEPKLLRQYFRTWLDFDVLAEKLTGVPSASIWVFYSDRRHRLGPDEAVISDSYLTNYIGRINDLKGTTARNVDIPNVQREYLIIQCPQCGEITKENWLSEKGVDASLIVHLFDTMESWDVAYLLAGDADYVPAVTSLRRQGKIVIGVGFPEISSSLLRQECYSYIDIVDSFINDDIMSYLCFRTDYFSVTESSLEKIKKDGMPKEIQKRLEKRFKDQEFLVKDEFEEALIEVLDEKQRDKWEQAIMKHAHKNNSGLIQKWFTEVELSSSSSRENFQLTFQLLRGRHNNYQVNFTARDANLESWEQTRQKLNKQFLGEDRARSLIWRNSMASKVQIEYRLIIPPTYFESIRRRLQVLSQFIETIPNVKRDNRSFSLKDDKLSYIKRMA